MFDKLWIIYLCSGLSMKDLMKVVTVCFTGCNRNTVDMIRCREFRTKMDEFIGVKFHVSVFGPIGQGF